MKDRPMVVAGLIALALAIWGWNGLQLVDRIAPQAAAAEAVPEIPWHLAEVQLEGKVPQIARDPFGGGKVAEKPPPGARPAKPAQIRPQPLPRGTLQMIMNRAGVVEAVVLDAQGKTLVLREKDHWESWTVAQITLEKLVIKQPTGQTHEYTFQ